MRKFFVDNVKDAWRWFSIQLAAVMVVLPLVWAEMPEDLKSWVPEEYRSLIVSFIGFAIIFGRLKRQGGNDD